MDINSAFDVVKRRGFLPTAMKPMAGVDSPLPIGYGQTNSQPSTVKKMLVWLGAREGDTVLDVGSGSGWTTALLAHIVGPKGKIYAVEKLPALVKMGQKNCQKAGVGNVEFFEATNVIGLPRYAPYDRILVSASAEIFPHDLLDQLKAGGKLVIPVKNNILEITKKSSGGYIQKSHEGFVFVPLLKG